MRILVVGATGTIGKAVVQALKAGHEVVEITRHTRPTRVDIVDRDSIRAMYKEIGRIDAVVSTSGEARYKPLEELTDEDFAFSFSNKLMGQVNLVRLGVEAVRDGGSFTLTSGILAQQPSKGSAVISLVNAGLEGFGRAAALEMPRGIRVNVVSPPWVSETLSAMGRDPKNGAPADVVARAYVQSVTGTDSGKVIAVS